MNYKLRIMNCKKPEVRIAGIDGAKQAGVAGIFEII